MKTIVGSDVLRIVVMAKTFTKPCYDYRFGDAVVTRVPCWTGIVIAGEAVCTSTLMVATESLHPVNTNRWNVASDRRFS